MTENTETVQNGQNDSSGSHGFGVSRMALGEAICAEQISVSQVDGIGVVGGGRVYALMVRGTRSVDDTQGESVILMRTKDMAAIVAAASTCANRSGDMINFATQLGVMTERYRNIPADAGTGTLIDQDLAAALHAREDKNGVIDPADIADVLAGRVPSQPGESDA